MHAADVKPVAAVVGSSPFDLGAAWRRLSSSLLSLGFWLQYAVAIRWGKTRVYSCACKLALCFGYTTARLRDLLLHADQVYPPSGGCTMHGSTGID